MATQQTRDDVVSEIIDWQTRYHAIAMLLDRMAIATLRGTTNEELMATLLTELRGRIEADERLIQELQANVLAEEMSRN